MAVLLHDASLVTCDIGHGAPEHPGVFLLQVIRGVCIEEKRGDISISVWWLCAMLVLLYDMTEEHESCLVHLST